MTINRTELLAHTATVRTQKILAVQPIVVETDVRLLPLEVKVTAPTDGDGLPVIVFSHGYEWSMDAYEPLAQHWADAGFIVVQPTHLDSRRYGIALDDPAFPNIWRTRISDLHAVIDSLADIINQVPTLAGRADTDQLAVV